jgi:hypothetical protein
MITHANRNVLITILILVNLGVFIGSILAGQITFIILRSVWETANRQEVNILLALLIPCLFTIYYSIKLWVTKEG